MDCIYCNTLLPERGFFCPNCAAQAKCKSCSEVLIKDANACVFCGEEVSAKKVTTNINTIEFTESENGRTFKAVFSDTVGQSIIDSLGLIFTNQVGGSRTMSIALPSGGKNGENLLAAPIDDNAVHDTIVDIYEVEKLQKIISLQGDTPVLLEYSLKAKSKREYGQRLVILLLYYKSLLGIENVSRKDISALLSDAGVEDGHIKSWINRTPLMIATEDFVEIRNSGRDAAKRFVEEIFNPAVVDQWRHFAISRVVRKPGKGRA